MDNRKRVVGNSKDDGITALALRDGCEGKTVQFMALGDLCRCLLLERASVLAVHSNPGLAEIG